MPSWALLKSSWGSFGLPWGDLGALFGLLGAPLGLPGAFMGTPWDHLGSCWGHLGSSWGHLGLSCGHLGSCWGYLGGILTCSASAWVHLVGIFAHHGPSWGRLWPILGLPGRPRNPQNRDFPLVFSSFCIWAFFSATSSILPYVAPSWALLGSSLLCSFFIPLPSNLLLGISAHSSYHLHHLVFLYFISLASTSRCCKHFESLSSILKVS